MLKFDGGVLSGSLNVSFSILGNSLSFRISGQLDLAGAASKFITTLKDGIINAAKGALAFLKNAIKAIGEVVMKVVEKVKEIGKAIGKTLEKIFNLGGVISGIEDTLKTVVAALAKIGGALKKIGKALRELGEKPL